LTTLIELTVQIVSSHISNKQMTSDEMQQELRNVHATLKTLETSSAIAVAASAPTVVPSMSIKKAFGKNNITCLICNKSFITLKKHLTAAHQLSAGEYRKQFGIPSTQTLAAKNYVESRRQAANDRGQGEILARARAATFGKVVVETITPAPLVEDYPEATIKARAPKNKLSSTVPAVRVKSALPAIKTKAPVPMKIEKAPVPANISANKPATGKK
jgi:predicted transcriptional regulator